MTAAELQQAVKEGRAFVRGVNRREQVTRQRILSVVVQEDGQVFVCTTVSPYVVGMDKIEVRGQR